MDERGVTESDVRAALEDPDRTRRAEPLEGSPPSIIYWRRIGRRRCKVYVQAGSRPMLVVTVAWSR